MSSSIAYVSEPLPNRVLFGPFPKKQGDVAKLINELGVTHIVNLLPLTDQKTSKGLPADAWYECFWTGEKSKLRAPSLLRYPVPGIATKQRDWVRWYVDTAQRVAAEMGDAGCMYVNNESGLAEEATLAFTLCEILQRGAIPSVDAWITDHPHAQGVLFSPESRALLTECLEQVASKGGDGGGAGGSKQGVLKGWVRMVKRVKLVE